ncbi:MAG: radical SAM protein [Theionarchaea archaeon]|nr:radical SAM protein [Theionarchaea archaeon]
MCNLEKQGYKRGSCLTNTGKKLIPACKSTLQQEDETVARLIKSAHLSRPEHYFSVYQSGCNLSCKKCHSYEFSQFADGDWFAPQQVLNLATSYQLLVTYKEKREKVTAFHGSDLCRCCGRCVTDVRSQHCPAVLDPTQIILSPQGWGPARNILGFTGGDVTCCPEFYAECTRLIKKETDLYVLIETNGYGLTPDNLDILKRAGVDSFWLDIKAFNDKVHKELTGVSNERILEVPQKIKDLGFVLEVLSLYIPQWVETDQIQKIAELLVKIDPEIPFTILAYFPAYKMTVRSPTFDEMADAYDAAKKVGLQNVKIGNLGVLSK